MQPLIYKYRSRLNPDRQLLPGGYLEHMPIKTITKEELSELMCNMDFNPPYYYPNGLRKRKNEVGHDQLYRYVCKPVNQGEGDGR